MKVKGLEKWGDKVMPCELGNGNTAYYVNFAGTDIEVGLYVRNEDKLEVFDNIDDRLVSVILQYRGSNERLRLFFGDIHTGCSWLEEYDVIGTIGRTGGKFKVPILLRNSRSVCGGAILVGSLVRIDEVSTHRTLWKVDNFHVEEMTVEHANDEKYPYAVMQKKDDGTVSNVANFKTEEKAERWIAFMKGERYAR